MIQSKACTQISVRIPLKPKVFSVEIVFEKNENKQKRPGLDLEKSKAWSSLVEGGEG